jgi:hypothetical protein
MNTEEKQMVSGIKLERNDVRVGKIPFVDCQIFFIESLVDELSRYITTFYRP